MRLHPHAIAKDRAAGEWARRVDGDDADRTARGAQGHGQFVDERTLAGAWRPRDANQERAAGAGKDPADEIGAGRRFVLDEGDRPRQGARVAREDTLGQSCLGHCARSCRAMTRR